MNVYPLGNSARVEPRMNYRADIDGLRAVAVSAVVLHHIWPETFRGGFVGVDVFFVISGYLITTIIQRELDEDQFRFSTFYARRIRRIIPALFAVLAVVLATGYLILLPSDYATTIQAAVGAVLSSSNIFFWKTTNYFAPDAKLNPLLHTWSLGVEEQFYFAYPLLLFLLSRASRSLRVASLAGLALCSLVASELFIAEHSPPVFFLSPFRAWELLAGGLLAFLPAPRDLAPPLRQALAIAGLAVIVWTVFTYYPDMRFPGVAAVPPVLGAAGILFANSDAKSPVSNYLRLPPVVFLGLISYSLYLWHWPVVVFAKYYLGPELYAAYKPVVLASSIILGWVSYKFVEQPFRRGFAFKAKEFLPHTLVAASLLAFGVTGILTKGFVGRFDQEILGYDADRRPQIPFRQCDSRQDWCQIGAPDAEPTVLFWGDSHMLAWAPAIDLIMRRQGMGAYFVVSSSCPPLLSVQRTNRFGCEANNMRALEYLRSHHRIRTVVLGAFWKFYQQPGQLTTRDADFLEGGALSIPKLLAYTIDQITASGPRVVVLGDVPTYAEDVPLQLVKQRQFERHPAALTYRKEKSDDNSIARVIARSQNASFVDPVEWMCRPQCIMEFHGRSLYRDKDHLSVAGAFYLADRLGEAMTKAIQQSTSGTAPSPQLLTPTSN